MRKLLALAALLIVAGCASTQKPAPPPPVVIAPLPAPVLAPDWRDWPVTPGNWSYARGSAATIASFGAAGGQPELALRCDQASRRMMIARRGAAPTLTVRTTTLTRGLTLTPDGNGYSVASVAPSDPLLDAIGFSRGHFAVEAKGLPSLMLPAWAEVERVTEDCRG